MGESLTLRVFKGPDRNGFRTAVEEVVEKHSGQVWWQDAPLEPNEDFRTTHNGNVHVVYLPHLLGADYLVCMKIGERLSIPWLELRVQEGSLWDYSLYAGSRHLDDFSTLPEYWGQGEEWNATQRGNPRLLARTWEIRQNDIEGYLRAWGYEEDAEEGTFRTLLQGKAYEQDEFEYGDIWQMFDMLRALGAVNPMAPDHGEFRHRLMCPSVESLEREP
jgi:hypothetical protein